MTTITSAEEDMALVELPEGVQIDELGRMMAPIGMLEPFQDNPRDPDDFDTEKSSAFRSLSDSIAQVGVREPIPVYRIERDGVVKLKQKAGHRRMEAVRQINARREEAYQARLQVGDLMASDPRPNELQLIEMVPVAIGEPPASAFDEKADMFLAESQRLKWRIELTLPFFKDTYEALDRVYKDDYEWIANRLGLPLARVKLLVAIAESRALYLAATSATDTPLPKRGREKTLRSVSRAAEILWKYRLPVCIRLTGLPEPDEAMKEQLRTLMVIKAGQVAMNKRPAGVYMERLAPRLRDPDKHPDSELIAWGRNEIEVLEFEGAPNTVGSSSEGIAGRSGVQDATLGSVIQALRRVPMSELTDDELNNLSEELVATGAELDQLIAKLRTEKRSRQAAE